MYRVRTKFDGENYKWVIYVEAGSLCAEVEQSPGTYDTAGEAIEAGEKHLLHWMRVMWRRGRA